MTARSATAVGMSERRLATLAVLRAHWEAGKESYVDTFLPFALEAVRIEGGVSVPVAAIRDRVGSEFGIEIPHAALETILRRARHGNFGALRQGMFEAESGALEAFDTAAARAAAKREQTSLIRGLVTFAESEHQMTVSLDLAADWLSSYLDRHATTLLAASHGTELDTLDEARAMDYVIASYISTILDREPDTAVYLEHVVVGTMLASALYTPDLARVEDPFACDVYLDSPALIDALGHSGETPARAARESLVLLRDAGAQLRCFDHTAVEIERKLCNVADHLRDGRARPDGTDTIQGNATRRRLSAADLERSAGRVRKDLGRLHVEVVPAPPHFEKLNIDETAAERILEERLGHSRKATLRFDLDSLTAIHRLREGRHQHRLETSVAIFATPHGRLVSASRQIFTGGGAPIAVSLSDLVTLAWLKRPRSVPDLPRLRIAADCYAAIQPSAGLIRRYVEEISALREGGSITEEDLYELRYGVESRRIMMMRTKGSAAAVNAETVREILEERNRQIEASARAAADRTAKAARARLADERSKVRGIEEEADLLRQRVTELEAVSAQAHDQLRAARASEQSAIDRRAARNARRVARAVFTVLLLAPSAVSLLSFPVLGPRYGHLGLRLFAGAPTGIRWTMFILFAVPALAVIILSLGWGGSAASLVRPVESRLRDRFRRRYRTQALFQLDDQRD